MNDLALEDRVRSALDGLPVPAGPAHPRFLDGRRAPRGYLMDALVIAAVLAIVAVGVWRTGLGGEDRLTPGAAPGEARIAAGGSFDGVLSRTDASCEQVVNRYAQVWPCRVVTIVVPDAGDLSVELVWSGSGNQLGVRLPLGNDAVACCAPSLTLHRIAPGELRVAVVFLNYQDAAGTASQTFTLRTEFKR